jgi:hypothetical protein
MDASDEQETQDVLNEPVVKPKRTLSEAQLRNLAMGRKLAIEARKRKGLITKANKMEKEFVTEEQVTKAQETIATIEKKKQARAPKPVVEPEMPPLQQIAPPPVAAPPPPNPHDEYYSLKLRLLRERQQQEQQQAQWHTMYQQAPSSVHAADIARQSLMARANKAVLERAYKEIFPDG